jgi:hypothetical protein
MSDTPLSPQCEAALAAFQNDPLDLPAEVEAHVRACSACHEARIVLLAQEDAPLPLVPTGYFERLPSRIQGKLPQRRAGFTFKPWMMAAAAALLVGVAGASFLAGRANRAPGIAQAEPLPQELKALPKSTLPFHDAQDDLSRLQDMTPEEAQALVERLEQDPSRRSE